MHPFYVQYVQFLQTEVYPCRLEFLWLVPQDKTNNPQFSALLLFIDEASFTQEGILNTRNERVQSESNTHFTSFCKHQESLVIDWCNLTSCQNVRLTQHAELRTSRIIAAGVGGNGRSIVILMNQFVQSILW